MTTIAEIIKTDRYKNSDYIFQKVGDQYCVKVKSSSKLCPTWLDIKGRSYGPWSKKYFNEYCLGTEQEAINTYNINNQEIIDITPESITVENINNPNNRDKEYYKRKLKEL